MMVDVYDSTTDTLSPLTQIPPKKNIEDMLDIFYSYNNFKLPLVQYFWQT